MYQAPSLTISCINIDNLTLYIFYIILIGIKCFERILNMLNQ